MNIKGESKIFLALMNRKDCSLMRHELAYILGQMQNNIACPTLASILDDETEDNLVRHESAEALGAIGDVTYLSLLNKYSSHEVPEIAETCQIAKNLIEWRILQEQSPKGLYLSVDPAPALSDIMSLDEQRSLLMDISQSLFMRYRAMFTLRDINTDESALALEDGFKDTSALFRHEIAYVLGQMQRACSIPGLIMVLENTSEHAMVRHEAAEALGAIGGETVEKCLQLYLNDSEIVVKESCQVALDTIDYWTSNY